VSNLASWERIFTRIFTGLHKLPKSTTADQAAYPTQIYGNTEDIGKWSDYINITLSQSPCIRYVQGDQTG